MIRRGHYPHGAAPLKPTPSILLPAPKLRQVGRSGRSARPPQLRLWPSSHDDGRASAFYGLWTIRMATKGSLGATEPIRSALSGVS